MVLLTLSEGNADGFWVDGHLSDAVKMFEAGKKYAARYTTRYDRVGSVTEMEHPFMAAVAWLGTQPGVETYYLGLDRQGYLDVARYLGLYREMENDRQRPLYRAVVIVKDHNFSRLGLAKDAGAQKLLQRWGFQAKDSDEYRDYGAFTTDCNVILAGVLKPYVEGQRKARRFLEEGGLIGPGAFLFQSRPGKQEL